MVNLLRYIWKNLHLPKKNYTGTARGARDKYQVCLWVPAQAGKGQIACTASVWAGIPFARGPGGGATLFPGR